MAIPLGWLCLVHAIFPDKHDRLLAPLLSLDCWGSSDWLLPPHYAFPCQLRLQGLQPWSALPDFPGFSLKSQLKWQSPHNSCILCACRTNITWIIPASATVQAVPRPIWTMAIGGSECFSDWTLGNKVQVNNSLGSVAPGSFLKNLWNKFLYPAACDELGYFTDCWDILRHPVYCPSTEHLAFYRHLHTKTGLVKLDWVDLVWFVFWSRVSPHSGLELTLYPSASSVPKVIGMHQHIQQDIFFKKKKHM